MGAETLRLTPDRKSGYAGPARRLLPALPGVRAGVTAALERLTRGRD